MATCWGVAGCGLISHDFTTAIGTHEPGKHKVVACAARKLEAAQEFAKKHGIEKAYGDYAMLAQDPQVEVVYVGAINPAHLPLAKMFIEAGKAVLCEKPLAMNLRETKELVELARDKGVFLMEAVWSRCLPAYRALAKELEDEKIGEVKQVIASFGEVIAAPRMHSKELGGGTILDLGIYTIQLAQLVFGGETWMNGIPLLSLPRKSFALPMPHLHEPSPCARHCFTHAQAIALRMRAPLLCACAGHYTAHVHNSQTCVRESWIKLWILVEHSDIWSPA